MPWVGLSALAVTALPAMAWAADASAAATPVTAEQVKQIINDPTATYVANTVWTLIAAMLVFFMNAGFATLETGLCRRKNAVNILSKNFIVFGISSIAFWIIGFGLMFGNGNGFVGTTGFLPSLMPSEGENFSSMAWSNVPIVTKFFFQLVFAGTAATIVSGAVAERIKFGTFMVFSFVIVAFIYTIPGHWIWGGGWLSTFKVGDVLTPFHDFSGSGVIHSCGGWAALAGVLLLGPRIGKYNADGTANPIPGHNMGLAAIGTFILWLGWFGFNPGSTMAATPQIGHIAVTTNTAAAFGSVAATVTAWLVLGKPDFSMILNGCLAGLVAITAPCAVVTVPAAAVIGTIAGAVVVLAVLFWDKLRVDDPVGALSVHLVGGTMGVLAVGLFASPEVIKEYAMEAACQPGLFYGGTKQIVTQLLGFASIGGFVLAASLITWAILKATMGIRVTPQEEMEGLDIGEHGMEAYPGFAGEAMGAVDLPRSTPASTSAVASGVVVRA
ncbi:MAG TPA: ammonium transporter [Tepidisphaeraceae bacterium]|nr:ammonium transporter [Tepidisphaeraceae bacterium]